MIRGYTVYRDSNSSNQFLSTQKKHHQISSCPQHSHHLESWVASSSFQKNPSQKREKFQRQNRSGLAESKNSYTSQVEALNSAAAELMNSWDLWNLETNATTSGGWEGSWVGFRTKRKERCFLVVDRRERTGKPDKKKL